MTFINSEQRFDTVVIGGGQAGLSIGYYLARQGRVSNDHYNSR